MLFRSWPIIERPDKVIFNFQKVVVYFCSFFAEFTGNNTNFNFFFLFRSFERSSTHITKKRDLRLYLPGSLTAITDIVKTVHYDWI